MLLVIWCFSNDITGGVKNNSLVYCTVYFCEFSLQVPLFDSYLFQMTVFFWCSASCNI